MARLYANENFPLPVVERLRELGHDVSTTQDEGEAGLATPDEEMLGSAAKKERVLLTLNRKHFVRLHGERPEHAGIVVCTFDPDFERQAQRIHQVLESQQAPAGQLLRVNRPPPDAGLRE